MKITRKFAPLIPSLCVLALFASSEAKAALILNTNVIVNGDAESGAGATTNNMTVPVPGFTTTGNFTVVQYRTPADPNIALPGVPRLSDPGPVNRGANFFAGGSNASLNGTTVATADQILDISNAAALIDAGTLPFTLSAYLGGYLDQRDNATFTAFFDNGAMQLGFSTLGPVLLADRNNTTELLLRTATGVIPVGTRQIDFQLVMTGIDGAQNDGYADNLSFIARGSSTVPEPGSMGLLAVGLGGICFGLRRKQHS